MGIDFRFRPGAGVGYGFGSPDIAGTSCRKQPETAAGSEQQKTDQRKEKNRFFLHGFPNTFPWMPFRDTEASALTVYHKKGGT